VAFAFMIKYNHKSEDTVMTKTEQIHKIIFKLLESHTEGLRTSELNKMVKEADPSLHPKTINGLIWKLTENFPEDVYKPERGLFKLRKENK
jgi:hypothetical protein